MKALIKATLYICLLLLISTLDCLGLRLFCGQDPIKKCCNQLNEYKGICNYVDKRDIDTCVGDILKEENNYSENEKFVEVCDYAKGKTCNPKDITLLTDLPETSWKKLLDSLQTRCKNEKRIDNFLVNSATIERAFKTTDSKYWNEIVKLNMADDTLNQLLCCPEILKYLHKHEATLSKLPEYKSMITPFCNQRDNSDDSFFTQDYDAKFMELAVVAYGNSLTNRPNITYYVISSCLKTVFTMDTIIYILRNIENEVLDVLARSSFQRIRNTWTIHRVILHATGYCIGDDIHYLKDLQPEVKTCLQESFNIGYYAYSMRLKTAINGRNMYHGYESKDLEEKRKFTKEYSTLLHLLFDMYSNAKCRFVHCLDTMNVTFFHNFLWSSLGGPTDDRYMDAVKDIYERAMHLSNENCDTFRNIVNDAMEFFENAMEPDDDSPSIRRLPVSTNAIEERCTEMMENIRKIPLEKS